MKSDTPDVGSSVLVRLPDHRTRYLGVIQSDGEVFIDVLAKTYPLSEVQIIPQAPKEVPREFISEKLQETLDSKMKKISSQFG